MDFENEKTPLDMMGITIPNELEGLFAEPPLLEGEDPNLYWGLVSAMVKDRNPQNFLEWTYVLDMVSKLWEEGRLKRLSAGLMQGEVLSALMYFLEKIQINDEPYQTFTAEQLSAYRHAKRREIEKLAFKYFSKDPKEKQEVVTLLARYGITPATLQAKAAQENSDAIQMFETMITRRQKSRRKDCQEDEQRRQADKNSQRP
jgi:hypothetical protein